MTNLTNGGDAIRNVVDTDTRSGRGDAHEIEDVIEAAFHDIPTGDWARLRDDLTDYLDEYVYGVDRP